MKEEIFDPLDMKDSMYYIQDLDPRRTDLLSRLTQIYLTYTSIPFSTIVAAFLPFELASYDTTAPRTTIYLDTGLLSTPADQRKFFDMLARGGTTSNGRRIIGKDMIAEMSQTQNKFYRTDRAADSYISHSRGSTWGLGATVLSETSATAGLIGGFESKRAITFSGFLGALWGVDFQHDIRFLGFTQSIPSNTDPRRVIHTALGARKCMDPSNDPIANAVV
jgi:CubicO group peptidase (beta-lactamase class C family)